LPKPRFSPQKDLFGTCSILPKSPHFSTLNHRTINHLQKQGTCSPFFEIAAGAGFRGLFDFVQKKDPYYITNHQSHKSLIFPHLEPFTNLSKSLTKKSLKNH